MGNAFLSRAAFAQNQDRCIAASNERSRTRELTHEGACLPEVAIGHRGKASRRWSGDRRTVLMRIRYCLADELEQFVNVEGLFDILKRAALHGFNRQEN